MAQRHYTQIPGYGRRDSERTADAALAGWWTPSYRRRIHRGSARMPNPGNLLNIGCFLDVDVVTPDGDIVVHSFSRADRVPLYWSENLRACFILPKMRLSECRYRPTSREDRLARIWAKGRPATCARIGRGAQGPLPKEVPALAISYLSDKFTHGRPIEYIHHLGPGVTCSFSASSRGAPRAIMVRGGNLHLTEYGLEG